MQSLRTGDFVTPGRIRAYCWIMLTLGGIAIIGLIATSSGNLDVMGRPLGTDFSNVWSAGTLVLDGTPDLAYDPERHYAAQQTVFDDLNVPFYGWHYPPFFLLIAGALAALPYGAALLVWMGATLSIYVGMIRMVLPLPLATLAAVAYPGVLVNLLHGQNGFLTAGLFGTGLALLNRRPGLAGIAFGILAYKPQFGVLIPVVLLASGRWKPFAWATATVLVLAVTSSVAFGSEIWPAFLENTAFTRTVVLEGGAIGWHKMQSLFSTLNALGLPTGMAYGAQGALGIGLMLGVVWLWRAPVPYPLQAAGLIVGSLLVSPYALDYDLMILAPAIGWVALYGLQNGFLDWEKTVLAGAWGTPLLARMVADYTLVPLGFLATAVLFGVILRRARHEARRLARF